MYCIDPTADEPIMMLDKHIGYDAEDGMGIDGAAFAQELFYLDTLGKKSIQVYVNCPGGSVIEGMSIYNAILKSNTPVDTHNVGIAASMGAVCFMAGRKRIMADYASMMMHNPSGGDNKKAMDALADSLSTMLSAKSGLTKDDVAYLMDKTTWMPASECLAKGFCTEIAVTSEANKKRMPSTGARAMWKEATEIVNNVFKNTNDMKKVTAKLKLVEGANEDAIVEVITAMENNLTKVTNDAKVEKEKLEGELKAAKDNVTAIEAKLKASEDALKLITDKAKGDADAALLEKSTAMVTGYAKLGRIKNDEATIKSWAGLAVKDFDGTEKMIKELPINKVANKVETEVVSVDDKFKGSAAFKMIEIANRKKQ